MPIYWKFDSIKPFYSLLIPIKIVSVNQCTITKQLILIIIIIIIKREINIQFKYLIVINFARKKSILNRNPQWKRKVRTIIRIRKIRERKFNFITKEKVWRNWYFKCDVWILIERINWKNKLT